MVRKSTLWYESHRSMVKASRSWDPLYQASTLKRHWCKDYFSIKEPKFWLTYLNKTWLKCIIVGIEWLIWWPCLMRRLQHLIRQLKTEISWAAVVIMYILYKGFDLTEEKLHAHNTRYCTLISYIWYCVRYLRNIQKKHKNIHL
jgi:hypothetical protein